MRLLGIFHKYPPIHNAGAEWMLHAILERFVSHGHEATVVFPDAPDPFELDGVLVASSTRLDLHRLALEHDAVITHLDKTELAVNTARNADRPLVHVVHNDRQLQFHRVKPGPDVLIVPNSEWIAAELRWPGQQIICRPHIDVARYSVALGAKYREANTLINLTDAKGSRVFYRLATSEPDRRFLGVTGAYGVQDRRPARALANVELVENTPNITDDVYARTRVLLMPSSYESWGRVAIEAAASGIPTIAAPTPGLLEALGDAGIFAERSEPKAWRAELRALDDPDTYAEASARAKFRALELEELTLADTDALELRILELIEDHRARAGAAYHRPDAMTILSSLRGKLSCPICGAASCQCAPDANTVAGGLTVHVFDSPAKSREPKCVYRTYRGDFNFTTAGAIRQGLVSDPDSDVIPPVVLSRLVGLNGELGKRLLDGYANATRDARDAFLARAALMAPRTFADGLEELVNELEADTRPRSEPAPGGDGDLETALAGRVGAALAWVGEDPDRATQALEAERAGKNRPTLIEALEKIGVPA